MSSYSQSSDCYPSSVHAASCQTFLPPEAMHGLQGVSGPLIKGHPSLPPESSPDGLTGCTPDPSSRSQVSCRGAMRGHAGHTGSQSMPGVSSPPSTGLCGPPQSISARVPGATDSLPRPCWSPSTRWGHAGHRVRSARQGLEWPTESQRSPRRACHGASRPKTPDTCTAFPGHAGPLAVHAKPP